MDLTASARISRAEEIVREQRSEPLRALRWEDSGGGQVVELDDYLELEGELGRLQAAVLGEDQRNGETP